MDVGAIVLVGLGIVGSAAIIGPTTKYAIGMSPYIYANTRCSGRLATLLTQKEYEDIITSNSVKEMFAFLEDSYYAFLVEHAESFADLSRALEKDAFEQYEWLQNLAPDAVKRIVAAMQLKFEVNALKSAINNLNNGKKINDGEPLNFIINVNLKLKLEGVNDIAGLLSAVEGTAYAEACAPLSNDDSTTSMTNLDKVFFGKVLEEINDCKDGKASEPFLNYWRTMIDLTNVKLAIRSIGKQTEYLPGGRIAITELEGLQAESQVENVLNNTVYVDNFTSYDAQGVEQGFHRYLIKQAAQIGAAFTLKSGTLVKYIIMKELEVRNLHILSKLKSEGFAEDVVRSYVTVEAQ